MTKEKRFVVLSGPACAGKGPLQAAVNRFYPGLLYARPILCHSRLPRVGKGEVHGQDYYFLPPALIASLRNDSNFAASPVRSDWQAIDLLQVEDLLSGNDLVFAEVFHTFGDLLASRLSGRRITLYSVFLLPVTPETPDHEVVEIMRGKLKKRGTDKQPKLNERAESAPVEMRSAPKYTHRIVNPATEENVQEWGEFGTRNGKSGEKKIEKIGDLGDNARWLVEEFVKIAKCEISPLSADCPFLRRTGGPTSPST